MINQIDAIRIARLVEPVVAPLNGHVALTGGCLYKDGNRKDLDLTIFRHGVEPISIDAVIAGLESDLGWHRRSLNRRVVKMETGSGLTVDLFFVEEMPACSAYADSRAAS